MKHTNSLDELDHWSLHVKESLITILNIQSLDKLLINGGAENGQFCWINKMVEEKDIECHSGKLDEGDILVEIQGQKVVGYTLTDIINWIRSICNSSILIKSIPSNFLTKDLRTYLGTRFVKNSIDHDLQQVIRINIYRRTVPCTTRQPRSGEVNGVDYQFVTIGEFEFLEKNNRLLESGSYEGNRYGTPKPSVQNITTLTPKNQELPHGWDMIDSQEYGTYYIDHINKRTQLEHPVYKFKKNEISHILDGADSLSTAFFTTNPEELRGTFVMTELIKSVRGLGFTIVGGNDAKSHSFLQIKGLAPEGPAALDGRLQPSDVLVNINNQCVLGGSREQVTDLFRVIPIGGKVRLEICRGYPLPFDPDDPNNEIITTVAVSAANSLLNTSSNDSTDGMIVNSARNGKIMEPSRHTVCVQRGSKGFGFTVLDGEKGHKVKEIRDKQRCSGLNEGDFIEFVDGEDVRNLSHSEFVDLLKSKPTDHIVEFNLLRNGKHGRRHLKQNESKEKHSPSNNSYIENISPNSIAISTSKRDLPNVTATDNHDSSHSSPSIKISSNNDPCVRISGGLPAYNYQNFNNLNYRNDEEKQNYCQELSDYGYYTDYYRGRQGNVDYRNDLRNITNRKIGYYNELPCTNRELIYRETAYVNSRLDDK